MMILYGTPALGLFLRSIQELLHMFQGLHHLFILVGPANELQPYG